MRDINKNLKTIFSIMHCCSLDIYSFLPSYYVIAFPKWILQYLALNFFFLCFNLIKYFHYCLNFFYLNSLNHHLLRVALYFMDQNIYILHFILIYLELTKDYLYHIFHQPDLILYKLKIGFLSIRIHLLFYWLHIQY